MREGTTDTMLPASTRPPIRRWPGMAADALRREAILVALLVFAALFFAYRWAVDLQRPGTQFPEGWRGFNDQGLYLREAIHLGSLREIPLTDFAYGPGYPAFAA